MTERTVSYVEKPILSIQTFFSAEWSVSGYYVYKTESLMNLLIIKELRVMQRTLHRKGRREEVAVDVKTPLFSLTVSLRLLTVCFRLLN
jgi:hypothetical protein